MRRQVRFFVSYAHANRKLAESFLKAYKEQTAPSLRYAYRLWRDPAILPGEDWRAEIDAALKSADLGLLLVSPPFLASDFITREELPKLVDAPGKAVIPVMLAAVDFDRHDLKGLSRKQIFRLDRPAFDEPKAYSDCSPKQRRAFVEVLFKQTEARLDKIFVPAGVPTP